MRDVQLVHEKCTLFAWFCGLELGCLTGGLWYYWLSKTSLSCWFPSYSSQPQQSTCFCITPVLIQCSLLGMEFPCAENCGKSTGLRAILLSLSQVQCLLSLSSPLPFCSSCACTVPGQAALLLTPTGLSFTPGSSSCSRQSRTYRELESKGHFLCWRCLLIYKYD